MKIEGTLLRSTLPSIKMVIFVYKVHLFSEKIYKDNLRINNNRKFFFEINGFDVILKVV